MRAKLKAITNYNYSYSNSTTTRTGLIRQLPVYGQLIGALSAIDGPLLSMTNGATGGNLGKIEQASGTDYNKSNLTNSSNTEKLVASNLTFGNNLTIGSNVDLTVKASNLKTTIGDITLAANDNINILSAAETSTSNHSYLDKTDRAKERGNTDTINITNISSTITSGSDLNIISGNTTTIQSSKLSSGDNLTVDAGNNLLLLTVSDASIKSEENKGGTAYAFSNGTSGYIDAKAVNNEITSNTNSANINSNLNLNANNSILIQYRAGAMEDVLSGANNNNQQLAYLKTINDLAKVNPDKVTLDAVADITKDWDQTTRGLTQAGTAVVAIAAVAVTVATMGSGAVMLTAAAASGAATASVSATNASMNTDSSLLGSANVIADSAYKDTTSKESVQNMAIAAATAGATYGVTSYLNTGSFTGTGAVANNSTIYVNPNLSNATVLTTNTANSSSLLANLGNSTAIASNILATSAIKGQSIGEVVAAQGGTDKVILNTALQIAAQVGAREIGNAAHGTPIKNADGSFVRNVDGSIAYTTPTINQGQQIALHAALGCGVGVGMSGGASGCAAGAAAGVVGELTAGAMYQEGRTNPDGTPIGFSRNTSIAMGGLSAGMAGMFTSALLGDDDSKMAKNIYAGNFVGTNAAANNATIFVTGTDPEQKKSSSKDLDPEFREAVEETFGEKLIDFEWTGGNTKEARLEAAQKLDNIFKNYEFQPGEKLNLVGFSHGGNVIKEFTQLYEGNKKIDNLIFLGTPHREDYKVDLNDLSFYANRISVSDVHDGVQTRGYIDGSVYKGSIAIPKDIRMMQGFINIRADQNLGLISNHISLPSTNIWNQNVKPVLINK